MSKAIITKDDMALLKEASEMFNETGCVPGVDGEQVPAERMVPDVKEYISETIDDPEALYDPEIWDTPGLYASPFVAGQKMASKMRSFSPKTSSATTPFLGAMIRKPSWKF